MPAPAWEDMSVFFADFAMPARLLRGGALVRPLRVIFDEPAVDALLGVPRRDGAGRQTRFETSTPTALAREAEAAGAVRGDELEITFPEGPRVFDVMSSPEVDGTGLATFRLAPQAGSGGR